MKNILKKLSIGMLAGFMVLNLCGCVLVMGALADTAKAKQTFNVSYSEAFDVVKGALKTIDMHFESATIKKTVAEIKGRYSDGRTVRILISKISDSETRIAVRVGTSTAGKKDAEKIMQAIIKYADLINSR